MKTILCTLIMWLLPLSLLAQSLFESAQISDEENVSAISPFGGFFRSASYLYMNESNEPSLQSLYSQFSIQTNLSYSSYGKVFTDLRFRFGNEYNSQIQQIDLKEAWIDLYCSGIKIRTGKQFISWGAASFINPSDQFKATNFSYRSSDPNDLNLGSWMVNLNLPITNSSSLQFIFIPIHQSSTLFTDVMELPEYLQFYELENKPALKDGSYGLNYDLRSSKLDLGLSFYHGYRASPSILFDTCTLDMSTMEAQNMSFNKTASKINSLGLNLSLPLNSYILRIESNYFKRCEKDNSKANLLPECSYALEIEQSGSAATIILGYYGKYIFDYKALASEPQLLNSDKLDLSQVFPPGSTPNLAILDHFLQEESRATNRLINYQMEEYYHSIYAIANVSLLNDKLELELPCMYNFSSKETSIMPKLTFNIFDNLELVSGYFFLHGDDNSLYNLISSNLNAFFISVKASF